MGSALLLAPTLAAAASCNIANSEIYFGAYDPLNSQPRDTNATLQATCTGSAGENVSYTVGVTEVAGNTNFSLSNGTASLQYGLYLDAGRSQAWGNGLNGTTLIQDSFTLVSGSANRNYTVYGRIFGGQYTATPGTYVDQLVITVSY
jgi:spore coat protein U-like protein